MWKSKLSVPQLGQLVKMMLAHNFGVVNLNQGVSLAEKTALEGS